MHTGLTALSWMLHVERFEKLAEVILNIFQWWKKNITKNTNILFCN